MQHPTDGNVMYLTSNKAMPQTQPSTIGGPIRKAATYVQSGHVHTTDGNQGNRDSDSPMMAGDDGAQTEEPSYPVKGARCVHNGSRSPTWATLRTHDIDQLIIELVADRHTADIGCAGICIMCIVAFLFVAFSLRVKAPLYGSYWYCQYRALLAFAGSLVSLCVLVLEKAQEEAARCLNARNIATEVAEYIQSVQPMAAQLDKDNIRVLLISVLVCVSIAVSCFVCGYCAGSRTRQPKHGGETWSSAP